MQTAQHKIPPQDLEAEHSVLGALLLDPESIHRVVEVLRSTDFYREAHATIFTAILNLYQRSEPADLITVSSELKKMAALEQVGGASYLATLVDGVPSSANVVSYCRIIREKAIIRRLIEGASRIVGEAYEQKGEVEEYLDQAERIIFDIAQDRSTKNFYHVKEVVKSSFKAIEQLYERRELITGIPTNFRDLDRMTSGFQPSDLIIIAGRPSMGKTAFALNVVESAAVEHGRSCAVFSLEMSKEQLVQRLLCARGEVDASKLRGGFLSESDWPRLTRAAGELSEAPIFIDDTPAITVLELRAKVRRLQREHGIDMVVIDYLQLMRSTGKIESREREIADISRSLKALAKEVNVPVIALSQLNRGLENRVDKRPMLSDLRESGSIEQDADVVAFVYRDEVYNKESPDAGKAEIIIGKQRNGPVGKVTLAWRGALTRFDNLSHEAEPAPSNFPPEYGSEAEL